MNSQVIEPQVATLHQGSAPARISSRVASLPASPIRRFFEIASTIDDVISLSIGEPDFVTPTPILEAGIRSLRAGQTAYTDTSGTLKLREAIIARLSQMFDCPEYDPVKEALITIGVSEGTQLAFDAILNPGDEVIIPPALFCQLCGSGSASGGHSSATGYAGGRQLPDFG